MKKITPIILSGGVGARLWPISRKSFPKQFSTLIGERSLFQQSVCRVQGIIFDEPSVVAIRTNNGQRTVVAVGTEAKKMIGRTPGNITTIDIGSWYRNN